MQDLSEELLVPPAPLISLYGDASFLDILAVSLKTCASPSSAIGVRYEPVAPPLRFPAKVRTHSDAEYATYVPDGILRRDWMGRHHNTIPAVVAPAVAMNVRASPAEWAATEASLFTTIQQLREYSRGRGTDVHIIVVQTDRDAPSVGRGGATAAAVADERALNEVLSERLTQLRRRAGLDANSVSYLFRSDVSGSFAPSPLITALDANLRDRALNYYRARSRHYKAVLLRVPAPAQSALRVRLLTKIAYMLEFRGKAAKSLKYYSQSYAALAACGAAVGSSSPVFVEARSLAESLNFKIMRFYLSAGLGNVTTPSGLSGLSGAQAAVMQFQSHLRAWDGSSFSSVAAAAHFGWLSKQYVIAAELLQLNLPRPRLDTKPNFAPEHYYHTAALWAAKRRQICSSLAAVGARATAEAEIARWEVMPSSFVGGSPALLPRSVDMSLSPGVLETAQNALLLLSELQTPLSATVVMLLEKAQATAIIDGGSGSAARSLASITAGGGGGGADVFFASGSSFSFYLAPNASRARIWRQWLIAEELAAAGDVSRCLRLLVPVACRLREGPWAPVLLGRIASRVYACASALGQHELAVFAALDELASSVADGSQPSDVRRIFSTVCAAASAVQKSSRNVFLPPPPLLTIDTRTCKKSDVGISPASFASAVMSSRNILGSFIAATLIFSHRVAPWGAHVAVRLLVSTILPDATQVKRIDVHCATTAGDMGLCAEGVNDSNAAAAEGAASASADAHLSVNLISLATGEVVPAGAVEAGEPDKDGVRRVTFDVEPADGRPRMIAVRALTLPPVGAPAFCVEFLLRIPAAGIAAGAGSGGAVAALAALSAAAATASEDDAVLVDAAAAVPPPISVSATALPQPQRKLDADLTCTDPQSMAGVMIGSIDVAATAKVSRSAMAASAHERTIFCEAMNFTLASSGFSFSVIPTRIIVGSATSAQPRSLAKSSPMSLIGFDPAAGGDAAALDAYLGVSSSEANTQRRQLSMSFVSCSTPACVAHMTRLTALRKDGVRDGRVHNAAPLSAHAALLVTEETPSVSLSLADAVRDTLLDEASVAFCSTGVPHALKITIHTGDQALAGGVLFISLKSARHAAIGNEIGGRSAFADINLTGATDGEEATRTPTSTPLVADALSFAAAPDDADRLDLLVPGSLFLLGADGKAVPAGGSSAEERIPLRSIGAIGISVPPLRPDTTFEFSVSAVAAHDSSLRNMRAFFTARLHAVIAAGFESSTALPRDDTLAPWLTALCEKPFLHRTTFLRRTLVFTPPLVLSSASIVPDVTAPLCDLAPLLLRAPPFQRLRLIGDDAPPSASDDHAATPVFSLLTLSGVPISGHVRVGSTFRLALSLRNTAAKSIAIASARLVAQSSDAFDWISVHDGDVLSHLKPAGGEASVLLRASMYRGSALTLQPGADLNLSLLARANMRGEWPCGKLCVTWQETGSAPFSTTHTLPHVAVHDPPLTCDLVLPSGLVAPADDTAVSSLLLGVRLANRSPHFVALEAAAYVPGSLAMSSAGAPGGIMSGSLSALPPLAAAPPTAFSVELLPGAIKTVTLTLPVRGGLVGYAGPVVLPPITLRASEGTGGVSAAALSPESALPTERRTLLALQGPTHYLDA